MQLEKIITLANKKVLLRFLAMERSLRATGCKLPLWVIPYDDDRFELPENAMWWPIPEISDWLKKEQAHPTCIKYQCLTTSNYQYVDSDVIFLQNPEQVLTEKKGFITSCGHWRHPALTVTAQSTAILRERSTHWMQQVFNAGQYACDRALYTTPELQKRCLDPRYAETCLQSKYLDQPGLNLLVHLAQVPIHNLTLPPYGMESTWAGDYPDENFRTTWTSPERMPYVIHWAGRNGDIARPIDRLFLDYLTAAEQSQLDQELAVSKRRQAQIRHSPLELLRRFNRSTKVFLAKWNE